MLHTSPGRRAVAAFDLPVWHGRLGGETLPAIVVPLPLAAARAVVAQCQHTLNRHAPPSPEARAELDALEAAVSAAVEASGGAAFVRLSSRSPKDAVVPDAAAYRRRVAFHCAHCARPGDPLDEANARILALSDAINDALCVHSGREAMHLLCGSERVRADLVEAIEAADGPDGFTHTVVVRPWDRALRYDLEFRLFVRDGRLTAATQYNHFVYVPSLPPLKPVLEPLLIQYWRDTVAPRLASRRGTGDSESGEDGCSYDSYVCDLAVYGLEGDLYAFARAGKDGGPPLPDAATLRVRVVEINPFVGSGGALFSWRTDADVLYGRKPFEFRVRTEPDEHVLDLVGPLEEEMRLRLGEDAAAGRDVAAEAERGRVSILSMCCPMQ